MPASQFDFDTLFFNNPQPMIIYRLDDLMFVAVNDAATALYGYSRDEFLRMDLRDIRPPSEVPALMESIRAVSKGSYAYSPGQVSTHRKKDGTLLEVRVSAHGVRYHDEDCRLVSIHDITEERELLRELRSEKEFSEKILDTMINGVVVCDESGAITYYNPALRQALGLPPDAAQHDFHEYLSVLGPDGKTPLPDEDIPLFRALHGETVRQAHVAAVLRGSGKTMQLQVNASPLFTSDRRIEGAVAVAHDITAMLGTQQALEERERTLSTLMKNLPGMVYRVALTPGSPIEYASSGCLALTGLTPEELMAGRSGRYAALVHPDDRDWLMKIWDSVDTRFKDDDRYEMTYRIVAVNGTVKWVWEQGTALRDAESHVTGIEGIVLDISERVRAQEALALSEERFARATRGANDGIFDWNLDSGETYFSDRWHEQLGLEPGELEPSIDEWMKRVHEDDLEPLQRAVIAHTESRTEHFEIEHRMLHHDGTWRWMLARGSKTYSAADDSYYLSGSHTDVTQRKQAEAKLQHDAMHDVLTGLPNRALLTDRLEQAIRIQRRIPARHFALLYLDLDRFKYINDSLGHAVGDDVLREVTRRWSRVIREYDTLARLGGDEFSLLFENIANADDVMHRAHELLVQLEEPIWAAGQSFGIGASIGIVLSDAPLQSAEDYLRDADNAMYQAKAGGRNQAVVFEPSMRTQVMKTFRMETELREAILSNQLQLYYQPIVAVDDGAVSGYEALVRWPHPEHGMIPPMEFIPFAEESGLIVQMDLWVLDAACRQMIAWRDAGKVPDDLAVSVNLSARQMGRASLPDDVAGILARNGLDGRHLKLELTETALIANIDTAKEIMKRLKELGVGVVLDDFGTGYSSLSYLYQFPFDGIKVDQSFVRQLDRTENVDHLMQLIQTLGERMKVRIVPEGIERVEEFQRLKEMGFKHAQGYYFGKPLPPDEAVTYIERSRCG